MIFGLNWQEWILGMSLTLPRLLAAFGLLPFMGRQSLPGLLRTGVAVSLCLVMVPFVVSQSASIQLTGPGLFIIVIKEVILGILIGYPLAALFWALEGIGFYIDNQRGSAMASSADPLTGSDTTPLGVMFTMAFTAYFMSSGAFLLLLGAFYKTYQIWPVASFAPTFSAGGVTFYLDVFDKLLRMIVVLSAPIIVAMFLSEFALALVSRFAPQLNVFFLAMPIKSAIAVFLLLVYWPILFNDIMAYDGGFDGVWRAVRGILE